MIESRFSTGARARLWDSEELPRLTGPSAVERVFHGARSGVLSWTGLAIEVAIPRGGVMSYGLLGGVFQGRPGDSIAVSVYSGEDSEFSDPLAGPPEKALIGLPAEYVTSVLEGFLAGKDTIGYIPGGSLAFDRAVHGAIGSSRVVFRALAATVTRLALGDPEPWEAVLQEEFAL
jgi:hypothetical protein